MIDSGGTMQSAWVIRLAIVAVAACAALPVLAAPPSDAAGPCAAKASRIDAELARAKAKGNAKAVAALERARGEMARCSDDGLREMRKMALEQAQRRIDLRAADLKQAEASGDAAKIKKAQQKLDSARKVYAQIESSPL